MILNEPTYSVFRLAIGAAGRLRAPLSAREGASIPAAQDRSQRRKQVAGSRFPNMVSRNVGQVCRVWGGDVRQLVPAPNRQFQRDPRQWLGRPTDLVNRGERDGGGVPDDTGPPRQPNDQYRVQRLWDQRLYPGPEPFGWIVERVKPSSEQRGPGSTMTQARVLTAAQARTLDRYWRAANYLSVGQIYLMDNPLLTEPLRPEHIKPRLLGHWGTSPGLEPHLGAPEPGDLGPRPGDDVRHRPGPRRPGRAGEHLAGGQLQRGVSERAPRRGRDADAVPPVLLPRRGAQPRGAADAGLDPRGRRARLLARRTRTARRSTTRT